MIDLRCLTEGELQTAAAGCGGEKYRGIQIFEWLNKKKADNFDEMNNIPKSFSAALAGKYYISPIKIIEKFISSEDDTIKYLFELEKQAIIESVRMKQLYGNTVCVSTQAGCNMACAFCASAIGGKARDLSAGEMAAQIYQIEKDINERVKNVVLMGSGEPLENYENSLRFINLLLSERGANLSQRHITLSTCGLTDKIIKLANEKINGQKLQITLAVSLHAPNDEIRQKIMPVARKYCFKELLDSCRYYIRATNRRITFEYALIKGLNDSRDCAEELSIMLKGILCHVNVIPINEVSGRDFVKGNEKDIEGFVDILGKNGIAASVRKERGADVNAACGQLRRGLNENKL